MIKYTVSKQDKTFILVIPFITLFFTMETPFKISGGLCWYYENKEFCINMSLFGYLFAISFGRCPIGEAWNLKIIL